MGQISRAPEIRRLLSVARMLRAYVSHVTDSETVDLYLRAAAALDDRATRLASCSPDVAARQERVITLRPPVNVIC